MKESSDKLFAVLTGDIVKSGKLSPDELQAVKNSLEKAVKKLDQLAQADNKPIVQGTIDFYRGDGWQLLLSFPKYSLRTALFLRAFLKMHNNIDTRISVGIGPVSSINHHQISQSIGTAFELSGNALDDLKTRKRMIIAFPYYMEGKHDSLISVVELCDAIVQKWTAKQAEAISWALRGLTQDEIADKFHPSIKSQSVGKHLRSACWYALEPALERTEKKCLERH